MKIFKLKIFALVVLCLGVIACGTTESRQELLTSPSEDKLVLVTGITGNQGSGVADALLAEGFNVRGLSRNIQSDASLAWIARGVEMVQGDFTDYASISAAVSGVDHLFLNITEQTPDYIEAAKNAIDSAYSAGAEHVVFTSNRPADPESGFNVTPERTKRMIELHLREVGGSYTTLRIPFMMENLVRERDMSAVLANGIIEYGEDNTLGYYMNSKDMGLLAAAAFADPNAWNGREVNMASDALTYRQLADLISELSGIDIAYRVAPWSEMRGPFVPNFQFFETNPPYDMQEIRQEFPEVQTLREYLVSQNYGEKIRALAQNQ